MEKDLWTKLIETDAGTCPDCGMALDLYARPVNVQVLNCCGCEKEFTPEYIAGYVAGKKSGEERAQRMFY